MGRHRAVTRGGERDDPPAASRRGVAGGDDRRRSSVATTTRSSACSRRAGCRSRKPSARARMVDPYLPFIQETLAKYPRLRASRLWAMVRKRGYTRLEERVSRDHQSAPSASARGGVPAPRGARRAGGAGGLGALRQAHGGPRAAGPVGLRDGARVQPACASCASGCARRCRAFCAATSSRSASSTPCRGSSSTTT